MVDRGDVRWVFFRDPATCAWHRLEWEHAPGIDAPFSADAARYVRTVGVNTHRHVDPQQAVADLLADWATGAWHRLEWEHAPGIDAPFSADAARYVRAVGVNTHRHVDPQQAVADLLADWAAGEVISRRDRNLAIRLASQRAAADDPSSVTPGGDAAGMNPADERARVSVPGVVDLLQRREQRRSELASDDDDVFAAYYAAHPDSDGLEVFDE